jgi:AraC-like DNA-binding protein
VFRAAFGLPPYKYLEQVRIQQARRLIRHGFPLTHVVHATGFSDQSHLTLLQADRWRDTGSVCPRRLRPLRRGTRRLTGTEQREKRPNNDKE